MTDVHTKQIYGEDPCALTDEQLELVVGAGIDGGVGGGGEHEPPDTR